ncbi:hypothetical protein GUJ93_ZPchr0002g23028 [Zizania palustris]|uniref:Uncharacterized protein n=1 Tax=Zizania palustris TaxID=103762 RepID=A0A8J5S3H3_ZIZPA|nr:hypothetical protein GUJ93_ZPchr0002g23028 [Zizania palustris]
MFSPPRGTSQALKPSSTLLATATLEISSTLLATATSKISGRARRGKRKDGRRRTDRVRGGKRGLRASGELAKQKAKPRKASLASGGDRWVEHLCGLVHQSMALASREVT